MSEYKYEKLGPLSSAGTKGLTPFNGTSLSRISSILFRVLPNVPYQFKFIDDLRNEKSIKSYFKNVRKLQEYPGLRDVFSSRGFDLTLYHRVKLENETNTKTFLKNYSDIQERTTSELSNKGMCGIKMHHLDFLNHRITDVFPQYPRFVYPSRDEILSSINKPASVGLPNPHVRKRDMLEQFDSIAQKFFSERARIQDIYTYPSAAFTRLQIRTSGLKVRLVNAVEGCHQCLESIFYLLIKSGIEPMKLESCMSLGLTQREVSKKVSTYTEYYTYSIDHKKWDVSRQQVVSLISFELLLNVLPLNKYQAGILKGLRNLYLTLPSFHPAFVTKRRWMGTVSGSGFTSVDNTLCNWIVTTITIYEYCLAKGIHPHSFKYKGDYSGDDLILGTEVELDFPLFKQIIYSKFGMIITLECEPSKPGENSCFFLGSKWINGVPYRSEKLMVASVIFGTGNFPKMTTNELFQSRFFEVFGNSGDAERYWKRFKIPILNRLFFFNELSSPYRFDTESRIASLNSGPKKDTRGFWYNGGILGHRISSLWELR